MRKMLIDFLIEHSQVAKTLAEDGEKPTLEDLLMSYCEFARVNFDQVVALLDRMPQFVTEKLKLSNCVYDGKLPYDSLDGLTGAELFILFDVIKYLCFDNAIIEKVREVAKNGTAYNCYYVDGYSRFDKTKLIHWILMDDAKGLHVVYNYNTKHNFTYLEFLQGYAKSRNECKTWLGNIQHPHILFDKHLNPWGLQIVRKN